jgi:hypothetical protein
MVVNIFKHEAVKAHLRFPLKSDIDGCQVKRLSSILHCTASFTFYLKIVSIAMSWPH